VNKSELIATIATKTGLTKADAGRALEAFTETVTEELKKEKDVTMTGFGKFKTVHRKARDGVNPATGGKAHYPATRTAGFKPGSALKGALN
jgi:DNA-binding protein HU-beta